jgi:hypothetical protein
LIQESILNAIRDSIPIESMLRAYMDESVEEQVTEEIKEEVIVDKDTETNNEVKEIIENTVGKNVSNSDSRIVDTTNNQNSKLSFSEELEKINVILDDIPTNTSNDMSMDMDNSVYTNVNDDESGSSRLKILDESMELSNLDVHNIEPPSIELDLPDLMDELDFEVLE